MLDCKFIIFIIIVLPKYMPLHEKENNYKTPTLMKHNGN